MNAMEQTDVFDHARRVDPLRHAASLLWPNLPVLLAGSILVVLAAAAVRAVAPTSVVLAVLGAGLLVLPCLAALVRGAQVMIAGEVFGVVDLLRALRRGYGPTVATAIIPMATLVLADVAAGQWMAHREVWMLISLGLCLSVSALTVILAVIALPYRLRTGSRLVESWLVAVYVSTRRPVPVIAVVSAFVLLGWAAGHLSFALMIIFPGPLALLWTAAADSATTDCRHRLHPDHA